MHLHAVQGVVFALVAWIIVRVTWGRANTGARIGAILAVLIAVWIGVWLVNPSSAGLMTTWTAEGAATDITALGSLFRAL